MKLSNWETSNSSRLQATQWHQNNSYSQVKSRENRLIPSVVSCDRQSFFRQQDSKHPTYRLANEGFSRYDGRSKFNPIHHQNRGSSEWEPKRPVRVVASQAAKNDVCEPKFDIARSNRFQSILRCSLRQSRSAAFSFYLLHINGLLRAGRSVSSIAFI